MNRLNIFRNIRFIITLGCIGAISLIVSAWSEKVGNKEIVYITAKDLTHKENLFTIKDINKLEEKYPELKISYSYESTQVVQVDNRECLVWLIQTNENYRKWNKLSMHQGNFLKSNPYNKRQVVLDNEVAFSLFGKTDLSGSSNEAKADIKINEQIYKVEGVTKQTIFDKYKYKEKKIEGIGYSIGVEDNVLLNGFVVCNLSDEKLRNQEIIDSLLFTLERNKDDYIYISTKEYMKRLDYTMKFIRSSILVMLLIYIWKQIIVKGKAWRINLQDKLKHEYIDEYIRHNVKIILKQIISIGVMVGITILISEYFIKGFVEVCTSLKNTLVQIELYPNTIQIVCKSSQKGLVFCGIVEVFLMMNILKTHRKSREI